MDLIKAPDQRLKIQTKPVKKITYGLTATLKEMIKLTKTFTEPEGVGLASTQVGFDEAFFVIKNEKKFMMVINPKIISSSKRTKKYFEGCLSIPSVWGEVKRHTIIKVEYLDQNGQKIATALKDILAWIFQHEMDHLNGILFTERVLEQQGKFYKYMGRDKAGEDIFDEVTL